MSMKRITGHVIALFCIGLFMTGCAANPFFGLVVTKVDVPTIGLMAATDAPGFSKVGQASCSNILGLYASGDASLNTAMKNAGITKIHHVDSKYECFFSLYSKYTVIVYGE